MAVRGYVLIEAEVGKAKAVGEAVRAVEAPRRQGRRRRYGHRPLRRHRSARSRGPGQARQRHHRWNPARRGCSAHNDLSRSPSSVAVQSFDPAPRIDRRHRDELLDIRSSKLISCSRRARLRVTGRLHVLDLARVEKYGVIIVVLQQAMFRRRREPSLHATVAAPSIVAYHASTPPPASRRAAAPTVSVIITFRRQFEITVCSRRPGLPRTQASATERRVVVEGGLRHLQRVAAAVLLDIGTRVVGELFDAHTSIHRPVRPVPSARSPARSSSASTIVRRPASSPKRVLVRYEHRLVELLLSSYEYVVKTKRSRPRRQTARLCPVRPHPHPAARRSGLPAQTTGYS